VGETHTAEEVRARCIAAMPDPLGALYFELRNQLVWLHLKWSSFCDLFAKDRTTIDLLNEAAPDFFGNLQRMMWEDVLMHLCRLTDPVKSAGKDTLTVQRISELVPEQQLSEKVAAYAANARERTQFARDWRNRRLAHRELPPLNGETHTPLARASRQHVEDALKGLRQTMNSVSEHYLGASTAYEHSIEALGGVASLLTRLRAGVEARRTRI